MSLPLYLALGALAVGLIFGLSTDVRAVARRLFPPRRRNSGSREGWITEGIT